MTRNNTKTKGQRLYDHILKKILEKSNRASPEVILNYLTEMSDNEFAEAVRESKKAGIEITCTNPACGNVWDYRGDRDNYYATCPKCRFKVNLRRQLHPEEPLSKGGRPRKGSK